MAQSPAGKPRKTPKPAAPKKAAGSSASKPAPAPKPKPKAAAPAPAAPRKKPAPKASAAPVKSTKARKPAPKSPSHVLADTKPKAKPAPAKKVLRPATGQQKPAPEKKIDSTESNAQLGLTPKQQRFVDEYLVDLNGAAAARRAGYSEDTAKQIAAENLAKPYLQAAIAEARRAQQERTQVRADDVIREIALVAFADARELSQVHKGCCRHCWGEGHKRQRTVGEMNHDMELWQKDSKLPADFDEMGGIGYNPHRPPHPECPDCMGQGYARTVICDTRNLSPGAAALYAGAETTKYGIKVHTHSKMTAVEMLNKYLGIYEKDNQQKTDPLASLIARIATGNANGFTPVQVDPEHPDNGNPRVNGLEPQQDPDEEDGDD